MHHIYVIHNTQNSKVYIGQSVSPSNRWATHKWMAKKVIEQNQKYKKSFQVIHKAMAKHGIDKFEFSLLESFNSQEDADEAESFWIELFKSRICGYNAVPGGHTSPWRYPGVKEKLSGQNHWNYGNSLSERHKKALQRGLKQWLDKMNIASPVQVPWHKQKPNSGSFRKGHTPSNKLDLATEKKICDFYATAKSTRKTSKKFGVGKTTVLRVLKKHGCSIEPPGGVRHTRRK